MPNVTCPRCGTVTYLEHVHRASDEFCRNPQCDYPLFWAVDVDDEERPGGEDADPVSRLPGLAGKRDTSFEVCPVCEERNESAAHACRRCGALLHPEPVEPPPPPEVIVREAEPETVFVMRGPSWAAFWTVAAMCVVLAVAVLWVAVASA